MHVINPEAIGNPGMQPVVHLTSREAAELFGYWYGDPVSVAGSVTSDERCCGEDLGRATCTRDLDHAGRHMAATSMEGHVCVAWPGAHDPTTADLT